MTPHIVTSSKIFNSINSIHITPRGVIAFNAFMDKFIPTNASIAFIDKHNKPRIMTPIVFNKFSSRYLITHDHASIGKFKFEDNGMDICQINCNFGLPPYITDLSLELQGLMILNSNGGQNRRLYTKFSSDVSHSTRMKIHPILALLIYMKVDLCDIYVTYHSDDNEHVCIDLSRLYSSIVEYIVDLKDDDSSFIKYLTGDVTQPHLVVNHVCDSDILPLSLPTTSKFVKLGDEKYSFDNNGTMSDFVDITDPDGNYKFKIRVEGTKLSFEPAYRTEVNSIFISSQASNFEPIRYFSMIATDYHTNQIPNGVLCELPPFFNMMMGFGYNTDEIEFVLID